MPKQVPKPETSTKSNKGIGGRGAKRSGTYFEREVAKYFTNETSKARRIIGSGAFGHIRRDTGLLGDINIEFPVLPKTILAEAKFGYGGSKQITVKREWIEKIIQEAAVAGKYPALVFKFKGARGKGSRMIAFDWDTFVQIMQDLTGKIEQLEGFYDEYYRT